MWGFQHSAVDYVCDRHHVHNGATVAFVPGYPRCALSGPIASLVLADCSTCAPALWASLLRFSYFSGGAKRPHRASLTSIHILGRRQREF